MKRTISSALILSTVALAGFTATTSVEASKGTTVQCRGQGVGMKEVDGTWANDYRFKYGFVANLYPDTGEVFFRQGRNDETQNWRSARFSQGEIVFRNGSFDIAINRFNGNFTAVMNFPSGAKGYTEGTCEEKPYWAPPSAKF